MTTYYVSPSGSDANNGLGPDASAVTNKPWLTIGKALGASGIASGDTVYLAPGTYREVVTVAMTSATAETFVLGDPANAQGFKNGSGVLLTGGEVTWSNFTTDDTTAPGSSALLDLSARDYLTFQKIAFRAGRGSSAANAIVGTGAYSTNIKFSDCLVVAAGNAIQQGGDSSGNALNWTIDRCIVIGGAENGNACNGISFQFYQTASGAADYDCGCVVKNSLVMGDCGIRITSSGTSTYKGGGLDIYNCTIWGTGYTDAIGVYALTGLSTSVPITVENCLVWGRVALSSASSGQITEDYNIIRAGTARTNVSAGSNSQTTARQTFTHWGESVLFGTALRPWMTPVASSKALGFGNSANGTTYDLANIPRPSGGASASKGIGAYERANTGAKETSTVRTGSNALKITGPGVQDFDVPVSAASTTVTVYGRFDGTYTGTKPQMIVLNGEEAGVTTATDTMVEAANTWEQLSLNFTPTAAGIVTVRLQSNDTNGGGAAFFDDFAVT